MRKLMIGAALFVLLLFLAMANVGCDGASNWTSPVTPVNPVNPINPIEPSTGMVAFIEDTGSGDASTFNSTVAWKEQAATAPGVNRTTRNVYSMQSNGTGLKKLNDQPFDFHSVYMLPDGSKMVFAGHAPDGYSQIYSVQLGRSFEPVQLTSTPGHKMDPMFSADGTKVVFMYANLETKKFDIAVMNADGSNQYVIPTPADWYIWHPSLSPDGTRIAVEMWNATHDQHAVFLMNADGSNITQLTHFGLAGYPAFSPDDKQIVFSSMSFSLDVFTINTDGTGMKHLQEGWDPMFVGNQILFIFRPGPGYNHDQIYSSATTGQLTHTAYDDAFEMSL